MGRFKGGDAKDASVPRRRDVEVLDVVPVCHEVPTKPIVDMALRLVDAHLSSGDGGEGGGEGGEKSRTRIGGWYTANACADANGDDDDDENSMPNPSACRIASSLAECSSSSSGGGRGGGGGGDDVDVDADDDYLVLLLVSTSRLVNCVRKSRDDDDDDDNANDDGSDADSTKATTATTGRSRRCLPICVAFDRPSSSSYAFVRRVDDGCMRTASSSAIATSATETRTMRAIAGAIRLQIRDGDGGCDDGGYVCDFVDHMESHASGMDWIVNSGANSIASNAMANCSLLSS